MRDHYALTLSFCLAGCDPAAEPAMFRMEPIGADAGPIECPVVTGISTGSLETTLGAEIELQAFASSQGEVSFRWKGGQFDPPDAASTRYLCTYPAETVLSVAVSKPACPEVVQRISVTCSGQRCSDCLQRASASEMLARCTSGDHFERGDTERCIEALVCSLEDHEHCAADPDLGPLACYCGARGRTDGADAWAAQARPAGVCAAQWAAAAGCEVDDVGCVLARFFDLGRPSGAASFTARVLAGECSAACSAGANVPGMPSAAPAPLP